MSSAAEDLYAFVQGAVKGIVDDQHGIKIEAVESGARTVTIIIHCNPSDLKFVYSRARAIKFIAIAIAQRHKSIVNIIINE